MEHFEEILNPPPPQTVPDTGPDGIPPEALKPDAAAAGEMLHPLLVKICEQEQVPANWKHGYLMKLHKKGDLSQCSNW